MVLWHRERNQEKQIREGSLPSTTCLEVGPKFFQWERNPPSSRKTRILGSARKALYSKGLLIFRSLLLALAASLTAQALPYDPKAPFYCLVHTVSPFAEAVPHRITSQFRIFTAFFLWSSYAYKILVSLKIVCFSFANLLIDLTGPAARLRWVEGKSYPSFTISKGPYILFIYLPFQKTLN